MGSHGPLFRKIRLYPSKKERSQVVLVDRLKDAAVYNMLKQRAIQAGMEDSFTPHDFRKTFISHLLNSGETDPMTIARLTGHKSIETIQLYDLTVDNRAKKAAQAIETPYISSPV
jgi:integrase/recombinase XerD